MTATSSLRCSVLLLLYALTLVCVMGLQPHVSPRGWQAAKQAEHQRAQAAAAAVGQSQQQAVHVDKEPRKDPLALSSVAQQRYCSVPAAPPLVAPQLAAGAALFFAAGVAAGMLLLHLWLQWQKRLAPVSQPGPHGTASCAVEGSRIEKAGPGKAAEPAGAETAGGKEMTASKEGLTAELKDTAKEAAESSRNAEESAAEAAVAAAVQDLVLQQSGSASSRESSAALAPATSSASSHAADKQLEQQHPPPEQQQQQGEGPLSLAGAVGTGKGSSVVDTSSTTGLALLKQEDQADIQAAAQLVLTMCQSMHIDPVQLDRGERLQLIYTMLHAWQAQQGRRHAQEMSRLGTEANELRSQQRDIAAQQAVRQAAKDAYRLSLERTAAFRRLCSDTLTFGVAVMVVAGAHQLLSRGLLSHTVASCGSLSETLQGQRWALWAAWRAGETLACYALSVGDSLLGLGVLLAAPWLVYRSGLLSDYHTMPLTKLFVGLGIICGLAGYLAVGKLGGDRSTWLAAWEAWVALHIAFSTAAHSMNRFRLRLADHGAAAAADVARMYEHGGGWLPLLMWVVVGVALPLVAGILPFR